jgi:transposase-like protein
MQWEDMTRYSPEIRDRARHLTLTTSKSAEQIAAEVGVSSSGVRLF